MDEYPLRPPVLGGREAQRRDVELRSLLDHDLALLTEECRLPRVETRSSSRAERRNTPAAHRRKIERKLPDAKVPESHRSTSNSLCEFRYHGEPD